MRYPWTSAKLAWEQSNLKCSSAQECRGTAIFTIFLFVVDLDISIFFLGKILILHVDRNLKIQLICKYSGRHEKSIMGICKWNAHWLGMIAKVEISRGSKVFENEYRIFSVDGRDKNFPSGEAMQIGGIFQKFAIDLFKLWKITEKTYGAWVLGISNSLELHI